PYLPVMAGIPVENADVSEGVLYDVRKTIAELVNDKFYGTLQQLAHQKNLLFSAESVSPTMLSDGMLHYQNVDLPMGEFWLRSPTHDKPNDMMDAISGAHIYGKNLVQAEGFTQIRMQWDEYPGNLKALGDRNLASGMNRLVFHVFMHNPWTNRKPGVTLDAIGLLFQRDQTWWPQAKGWIDYIRRCQALLQLGKPVTDLAVFTGEEFPRRSLLPERLVKTLPGLFGEKAINKETKRLLNKGQPLYKQPTGVTYQVNTTTADFWNDPLHGYTFDSFNPDALLRLTGVQNNRLELSTGASYAALVIPGVHKLQPDSGRMSLVVATKIRDLAKDGATIILNEQPSATYNRNDQPQQLQGILPDLKNSSSHSKTKNGLAVVRIGKGKIVKGPFTASSLESLGIARDLEAMDNS
ncbi:MAG TPA: glycosyl hydrolase, partial [Flavisolibacter sp.]|nr:glycosyl hydrolase [Flavisolibacter sp.]